MPRRWQASTKLEILGRAEAARRREEAEHLIAPRTRERMLHHRHELDVREAEVDDVVGELRCTRPVDPGPPRARVDLVDRHRLCRPAAATRAREPLRVVPLVLALEDDRHVLGRDLRPRPDRIGVQPDGPSRAWTANL